MSLPISPFGALPPITLVNPSTPAPAPADAGSFRDAFQTAVAQVNTLQDRAEQKVEQFLSGEPTELHEVAVATQQAELAFEMFQQVRNKVVNAYQEVMRMQL